MDPSMSDPHHPQQYTAFPPFTNPNPFAAPNHPYFTGAVAPPNNNHMFQAPLQSQQPPVPSRPALSHPPYSDMICTAIAALNEQEGSSKQAISRYIERIYTGILPNVHGSLMTHHLKSLKNSGVLVMVKKSYKLAANTSPASVAVAAAAAAAGLEPPRSDNLVNENQQSIASSTPPTQKRGRGRPPKAKPDVQPQTNGKPTWEQTELPVARPEIQPQTQQPIKRPPGRPRKDGALPTPKACNSVGVETVKRRGRPPSGRAAGRERKPTVVSAPASVFPYVANGGVRRRGRPKRVEAAASSVAPPPPPPQSGAEGIVKKRGRGRPPKIGGVIRKPMKPKRGFVRSGRPVGRPRKNALSIGASGRQDGDYGELKKKFELFQARAKDIVVVLKAEIGGTENQAVVQAILDLEGLTGTSTETTNEPQRMEEMQLPDEEHPETEPEPEGQGQTQAQEQGQAQTEAKAMQEALF